MRQELERLLDTHRAQRPEMQPQDYYKLRYQREFGCGHTAPAPETAGRHLMEEYADAMGHFANRYYYFFSKSGFSAGLESRAEKGEVRLLTLAELYEI